MCFFRDMYIFDRQPDRYVSRALNLISLVLARTVIENFVCISRKQLQKHQQQPNLTLETLGFGFSFGFSRISGWAGAKPQLSCPVTWNFKCHNFWQFDSRTEKHALPLPAFSLWFCLWAISQVDQSFWLQPLPKSGRRTNKVTSWITVVQWVNLCNKNRVKLVDYIYWIKCNAKFKVFDM